MKVKENSDLPSQDTSMQGYIEITQDGIGRIDRRQTPEAIEGLYTDGVETCLVVMIVSVKGVSLLHLTAKVGIDSVLSEFRWHDQVVFWTIAYNPKWHQTFGQQLALLADLNHIIKPIEERITPNRFLNERSGAKQYVECGHGFVSLSRKGQTNSDVRPKHLVPMPQKKHRHSLNTVNNLFLEVGETIPADFQFDGQGYTSFPKVNKTPEQVGALTRQPRYQEYEHTEMAKEAHAYFWQTRQPLQIDIASIVADVTAKIAQKQAEDIDEHNHAARPFK